MKTWSFDFKSQQLHQGTPLPHAGPDGTPCTWSRTPRQRGSRFYSHLLTQQCCSVELFFLPASVAAEVPASPRNHFCLREPSHRQLWGYPDEGSLCDAAERLRKGRFLSSAGFGWFFTLEGGAVKPTENGHKVHVMSPPGWAAGEHISENLRSLPHTRLVFRSFNKVTNHSHSHVNEAVITGYHPTTLCSLTLLTVGTTRLPVRPLQRGTHTSPKES